MYIYLQKKPEKKTPARAIFIDKKKNIQTSDFTGKWLQYQQIYLRWNRTH